MNARYQDPIRGQFLTEDPVFLDIGGNLQQYGKNLTDLLKDPQSQNAYSYSGNNPITKSDPTGLATDPVTEALSVGFLSFDLTTLAIHALSGQNTQSDKASVGLDSLGLVPFVPAAGVISKAAEASKVVKEVPVLLNGPIRITAEGLQHVLENHTLMNDINKANKSIFSADVDIADLIKRSTQQPVTLQPSGNLQRTFDVGKVIGFDKVAQQNTSIMTVITNKAGALKTAFPGAPVLRNLLSR